MHKGRDEYTVDPRRRWGETVDDELLDSLEPNLEGVAVNQMMEVSLNSVVGLMASKTMKLKGVICDQEVVLLIDPGATHNFKSMVLVK